MPFKIVHDADYAETAKGQHAYVVLKVYDTDDDLVGILKVEVKPGDAPGEAIIHVTPDAQIKEDGTPSVLRVHEISDHS